MASYIEKVICFENINTQETGYDTTNLDLEAWKAANPTLAPKMMFEKINDILERDDHLVQNFQTHCYNYDLQPSDIDKIYTSISGHTAGHMVRIVGLRLQNRKYPVIICDLSNKKRYKVSPKFIKAMMASASDA